MKKIIGLLILIPSAYFAAGQGLYNKGSVISLSPQTILTVPDSLVNNGTLINNGELTIAGAWINAGTYVAGEGGINFDSDLTQIINHNDQSVAKLTISGGGEKQFLANITVQEELNLESGVLVAGNGAKIVMSDGATVIGGSDNSHIRGPVEHHGQGNWVFPIGNGTTYLPVTIASVTDGAAVATLTLNDINAGEVLTGDFDLGSLSSQRYWELTLGAGNLNGTTIMLPLAGESALTSNADLVVVAGSSTATGPYSTLGRSGFSGSLTAGSVTSEKAATSTYYAAAALLDDRGIEVFNAVSPNSDGKNDYMRIRNIELYPDNHVTIFNRWGDPVFEITGYNNNQNSFHGESNINGTKVLPGGTYFYAIELGDGSKKKTGFLEIRQ